MWLSEQQKRPNRAGESRTGLVTMSGSSLAVRLEREMRNPELYGPAGYHWTPGAGDRVLVLKGEGERPCVIGAARNVEPAQVTIRAGTVEVQGRLIVNGVALEEYIKQLAAQVLEGTE